MENKRGRQGFVANKKGRQGFVANKKAQGLPTNAIILIIIGVVLLVILIIGFYAGWGTLAPWLSSDNVDTIVSSCETSCSTQSVFSYCSKVKELNTGETEVEATCFLLEKIDDFSNFGLEPCNIDCDISCTDVSVKVDGAEFVAVESAECAEGQKEVTGVSVVTLGNKCCMPTLPEIV